MYYGASRGDFSDPLIRIFRATSTDGVSRARSGEPVLAPTPGAWDSTNNETPSVVLLTNMSYRMYYAGASGPKSERFQIGFASSPNGILWTKSTSNPVIKNGSSGTFDSYSALDPWVILKDNTYYMWYVGISDQLKTSIGFAKSSNGIQWTKLGVVLKLDSERRDPNDLGVINPSVFWNGSSFEMLYTLLDPKGDGGPIFRAVSSDGEVWQKDVTPVLERGTDGHWTAKSISSPSILMDNGLMRVWYAGLNTDGQSNFNAGIALLTKSK